MVSRILLKQCRYPAFKLQMIRLAYDDGTENTTDRQYKDRASKCASYPEGLGLVVQWCYCNGWDMTTSWYSLNRGALADFIRGVSARTHRHRAFGLDATRMRNLGALRLEGNVVGSGKPCEVLRIS